MQTHLKALSLWEVIVDDSEPPAIRESITVNQLPKYEEDLAKKPRALACLHSAVSDSVFSRIMNFESPKQAWEKLKEEFDGGKRRRMIKLIRLKCEFEMVRMREGDTVREYTTKFSKTANEIRLLGENFPDSRVVEIFLVSLPSKFESKILALEELSDLETITAAELINKLQSQEQRVNMCEVGSLEGALFSTHEKRNIASHYTTRRNNNKQSGNQSTGK